MLSFGFSHFPAALLLSLAGPAAARRTLVQDASLSSAGPAAAHRAVAREASFELAGHGGRGTEGDDLVNIDSYLQQSHIRSKFAEDRVRCCCDAYGSHWTHKVHWFFHQHVERTRRCGLWTHTAKCGNVAKPGWAKFGLSSSETAEQACQVSSHAVPAIYEYLGSPAGYCSGSTAVMLHGRLEPAAVMLHEKFQVECDLSHAPDQEAVECVYGSPTAGKLQRTPECKMVVHCKASEGPHSGGAPTAAPAGLGLAAEVSCGAEGWMPEPGLVPICQEDGSFEPQPVCRMQPDYCPGGTSPSLPGKPTTPKTYLGDSVSVTCGEPGWESFERVRCVEGGGYEPQPKCSKAQFFCQNAELDLPGKPHFMAAAVDDPMEMFCSGDGYEMAEGTEATCGKDGQPAFDGGRPLCEKIKNYCSFFDHGEQGGLDLSSHEAELGQTVKVTCNEAGFEPTVEEVTCNALQDFDPEPGCRQV